MISYKQWQQINESMGHMTPLGIRKPTTIGELQSRWNEMGMMPQKCKRMSMGGGMAPSYMDDEEEEGAPLPLPKGKKGKKALPPPPEEEDDLGAELGDEEEDLDAEIGDEEEDFEDEEDDLEDPDALGDDLGDMGDEDPALDDEEGGDDMGMPMPPPMPNKKKKHGLDGAAMMLKGASRMVKGMKESKGCDCGGTCKKCKGKKKLHKEDSDFVASLKDQCGMSFFDINKDGTMKEDALFTPYDPNSELEQDDNDNDNDDNQEPQAGHPGFAPQQRLGNELGSMAEWTKKYRRKINEAIKSKEKKQAPKKAPAKAKAKSTAKARKGR